MEAPNGLIMLLTQAATPDAITGAAAIDPALHLVLRLAPRARPDLVLDVTAVPDIMLKSAIVLPQVAVLVL